MSKQEKLFCPKCGKAHDHSKDNKVVVVGKDILWESDNNVECICGYCQCLFVVNINSLE